MLIEFHVKNFRSLRDEQVLSLVASKDKTLQDTHSWNRTELVTQTLTRSNSPEDIADRWNWTSAPLRPSTYLEHTANTG